MKTVINIHPAVFLARLPYFKSTVSLGQIQVKSICHMRFLFFLQKCSYETWYEHHAIREHPIFVLSNCL